MEWLSPTSIGTASAVLLGVVFLYWYTFPGVVLDKDTFKALKLIEKDGITHNTRRYRFALPGGASLGLPTGQHISFKFTDANGRDYLRSYTPVTGNEQRGYVDFVIKVYPDGKMSQHVDKLKIGDTLLMRGPKGKFTYTRNMKSAFGMIAGGTGITPMYQIAREILRDKQDTTKVFLVFANVSADDILLKDQLDALARDHPDRFSMHLVLNEAPSSEWAGSTGYVSPDIISKYCPTPAEDCMILTCGPPPMVKAVEAQVLGLGYAKEQLFAF